MNNYILANKFHETLEKLINFPPGVKCYTIHVDPKNIVLVDCTFNATWKLTDQPKPKDERSLDQLMGDIKRNLKGIRWEEIYSKNLAKLIQ